jgi:hypothetical protein
MPHQANARMMESVATRLGLSPGHLASTIGSTGNTSAASIPLTLIDALDRGRVNPGCLLLLSGFGAGMSWASAVWRWGPTSNLDGLLGQDHCPIVGEGNAGTLAISKRDRKDPEQP